MSKLLSDKILEPSVYLEAFALKIAEHAICTEGKLVCSQGLLFVRKTGINLLFSIFPVTEHLMTDIGKMRSYLMRSARDKIDLNKGKILSVKKSAVFGNDIYASLYPFVKHLDSTTYFMELD